MERNGWEGIFPTVPTSKRSSAIIDFALTHDKSYLTVEVIDEGTPDHFPILFSSPFTAAEDGFFRKTNWKLFTFFLSLVNEYWNACVYNFDEQFFVTLFSSFLASLWDRTSEYITIRKYRPPWSAYLISLARNVNKRRRKWFERCIHEQIQAWCKDKGIYTDEQSGFTPNRHLQSRILSICEDLRLTVAANNRPALLIFVDFLSAFDNMWFPALIANLVELDMPLPLIKWIYQWLQERTMSIHHGYSQSKIVKLHVGAPQVNIPANAKWKQNGATIAGGHGRGNATNQLNEPHGLFVDDDQTVVIAEFKNHRIMQWKNGDTTNGQVVAGGKDKGKELHQLDLPTDVLIDKETDTLIICDYGNRRVVQWSRHSSTTQGEILIDNIICWGLAMEEQRYLYISDIEKHGVRRYQLGEKNGTLVAGGNGKSDGLNQLIEPKYLFVDRQQNVYISDRDNHRLMKWTKGATEGIVVAGGQGQGSALTQLYWPEGIFVDTLGTLYVADRGNHRIMRWIQEDKKQGTVIVDGNGPGAGANQFSNPVGLSFDRHGNLYVADRDNYRVQRFSIE
ncbi:unnamed protein product [Rotaria socialis]